jgi:coatomer subunit gamma
MLGMQACENTDFVKENAALHTLLLAGTFFGGAPALARCRIAFDTASGIKMELCVRSGSPEAAIALANAIV